MGCDVHAMIEKRFVFEGREPGSTLGWWVNCGDPEIGRNYNLFGILAGVRSDGVPAISEPRGIPEDACSEMKAWHQKWSEDAHSASYVTLAELTSYGASDLRKRGIIESYDVKAVNSLIRKMKAHMKKMPTVEGIGGRQVQDESLVRVVFFFDC